MNNYDVHESIPRSPFDGPKNHWHITGSYRPSDAPAVISDGSCGHWQYDMAMKVGDVHGIVTARADACG
jgi:hypothetical protein